MQLKQIKQLLSKAAQHPLYRKYNLIIIPAASILLGLVILILVTIPQIFKLIETNKQLGQIQINQEFYQKKIEILKTIDTAQYKQNLNLTLTSLPTEKDVPDAISNILSILSSSGVQLEDVNLGQTAASNNISMKFDVSGTLDQLKTLLTTAENSPRVVKISNIAINGVNGTKAQASLEVLAFYQTLDTNISSSVDQQITPLTKPEQELLDQLAKNMGTNPSSSDQPTLTETPKGKPDPFN